MPFALSRIQMPFFMGHKLSTLTLRRLELDRQLVDPLRKTMAQAQGTASREPHDAIVLVVEKTASLTFHERTIAQLVPTNNAIPTFEEKPCFLCNYPSKVP